MKTISDAQRWIQELKDAGWVRMNLTVFQAPCGCMYRGPYNAWRVMKLLNTRNCPNRHVALTPLISPKTPE